MTNEPDIGDSLSELERQVFLAVRVAGRTNVADMVERLQAKGRPLAYTTVMTVMTRLFEKGFLIRHKTGKAYLYEARDQREIAGELGARAVRLAIDKYGQAALMGLVQTLTPEQRLLVARLLEQDTVVDDANRGQ